MDWKKWKAFPYPSTVEEMLRNKQYINDREELFRKNGNGWWWGEGYEDSEDLIFAPKIRIRRNRYSFVDSDK